MLTFAEAGERVAAEIGKHPGVVGIRPDGYEDDAVYRVLIDWRDGWEFDAPTIIVDKVTGHVRQEPWWEGVFGAYDPDRMRPVTDPEGRPSRPSATTE